MKSNNCLKHHLKSRLQVKKNKISKTNGTVLDYQTNIKFWIKRRNNYEKNFSINNRSYIYVDNLCAGFDGANTQKKEKTSRFGNKYRNHWRQHGGGRDSWARTQLIFIPETVENITAPETVKDFLSDNDKNFKLVEFSNRNCNIWLFWCGSY